MQLPRLYANLLLMDKQLLEEISKIKNIDEIYSLYGKERNNFLFSEKILKLGENFQHYDEIIQRNLLRILLVKGNRNFLSLFARLFIGSEKRTLFFEVISESGFSSINAIIEIRKRINSEMIQNYYKDLSRLYVHMEDVGFYKKIGDFLYHTNEKIIIYSLKQFFLFPVDEVIDILKPLSSHHNWIIRANILEIFNAISSERGINESLEFLEDSEKKIREMVKDFAIGNRKLYYPVIVKRLENPADLKFKYILNLLKDVGDFAVIEKLAYYISNYKSPINERAFLVFESIIERETMNFKNLDLKDTHRRLRVILKEIIFSATEELINLLSDFIRKSGLKGVELLFEEYSNANSFEKENIKNIYFGIKEKRYDEEFLYFVKTGTHEVIRSMIILQIFSMSNSYFIKMYTNLMDKLTPEEFEKTLYFVLKKFPNSSRLKEKCYKIINDKKYEKWKIALRILGELGDQKLLKTLSNEIEIYELKSRLEIIKSLGNFNSEESVTILRKIIDDDREEVKKALIETLSKIDNFESTKLLFEIFSRDIENNEQVTKALIDRSAERYLKYSKMLDENLKKSIGNSLVEHNNEFVDKVSENLFSLNFEERKEALDILCMVADNKKEEVIEKLKNLLNDPDDKMRSMLSRTIGLIGGNEVTELVLGLLNDPNARVRANAVEVLPLLHDDELYKSIYPFLKDENNRVRANAVMTLYKRGDSKVIIALSEMLKSDDKWMRASAAYALGEIGDNRSVPILLKILEDEDIDVRRNGIIALGKVGDRSIIKNILYFLNSGNSELSEIAAEAIKNIKERNN